MRDLRISVTDRCNFRCPYCMPAEIYGEAYQFLPREEILTFEEIARLTGLFAEFGVTKARITGGEPLLRTDLPRLIAQIAAIEGISDVTLTTNGYLLSQQAQELKEAGLHRVTVSLDSVDDEVFKQMNGRGFGTRRVLHAIQGAADVGLTPIKINAVVQRGVNDHTVVDLARHFKGTGHIVRFIEYMDVGNRNGWSADQVVPSRRIVAMIHAVHPLEPLEPAYAGEVARRYRYADGAGEIGFISSVSEPFCGDCTRARLSVDGTLYTCLFAWKGAPLLPLLRAGADDTEVTRVLREIWERRDDRYSEDRKRIQTFMDGKRRGGNGKLTEGAGPAGAAHAKVEMHHVGG
jgi:cyclic pyranopterin phosphate synthase